MQIVLMLIRGIIVALSAYVLPQVGSWIMSIVRNQAQGALNFGISAIGGVLGLIPSGIVSAVTDLFQIPPQAVNFGGQAVAVARYLVPFNAGMGIVFGGLALAGTIYMLRWTIRIFLAFGRPRR